MQLTFPSYEFVFLFLPATLAGYYLLRRFVGERFVVRIDRLFLAICSLLFYLSFGLRNFAVLCAQALMGYLLLRLLLSRKTSSAGHPQRAAGDRPAGRVLFVCAVVCCVLFLGLFKYAAPFFPVALSFTSFSLISLLADAWRGEVSSCGFADYLLYFFFFPKLLQGPIVRYEDFREQAIRAASAAPTAPRFAQALFYFVLGLSKKTLLADSLARAVDYAYAAPENLLWMEAVLTSFAYAFQIYFDFSGYCDMGRAVAWMFGFDLPRNFDRPYRAGNILDFWRRWHSTLSQFLTRYIYIPLGGSRRGLPRTLVNTMLVFLLSGLWHGNGWGFLLWGCAHGALACLTRIFQRPLRLPRPVKTLGTFLFVDLAWIPFRAASAGDALTMLRKIFDKPWFVLHDKFIDAWLNNVIWYPLKVLGVPDVRTGGLICLWILFSLSAALVFLTPSAEQLAVHFAGETGGNGARRIRVFPAALLTAVLFLWCVLSFGEVSSFVYFHF